jgi:hypothetical protein
MRVRIDTPRVRDAIQTVRPLGSELQECQREDRDEELLLPMESYYFSAALALALSTLLEMMKSRSFIDKIGKRRWTMSFLCKPSYVPGLRGGGAL